MRFFSLIALAALACGLTAYAGGNDDHSASTKTNSSPASAPVMRPTESADDVVVTLPGAPVKIAAAPVVAPPTIVRRSPPPADPDRPVFKRPKSNYPDGFEANPGEYLHQKLGKLTEQEAKELLGEPINSRPSYDDDKTVNGRINSYNDPTGHFKQVELDFEKKTAQLRTVFVYPLQMTWIDCRKTFGANVRSTPANKGRIFYSYLNQRMDVLVDASGKVISLGMY